MSDPTAIPTIVSASEGTPTLTGGQVPEQDPTITQAHGAKPTVRGASDKSVGRPVITRAGSGKPAVRK